MVKESLLIRGNRAFEQGNYAEALRFYERLLPVVPEVLRDSIDFNWRLTERRLYALHGENAAAIIRQSKARARQELEVEIIHPHFDEVFYLEQNPDVAEAGIDPVEHYCMQGWIEGRDPHPEFCTVFTKSFIRILLTLKRIRSGTMSLPARKRGALLRPQGKQAMASPLFPQSSSRIGCLIITLTKCLRVAFLTLIGMWRNMAACMRLATILWSITCSMV